MMEADVPSCVTHELRLEQGAVVRMGKREVKKGFLKIFLIICGLCTTIYLKAIVNKRYD